MIALLPLLAVAEETDQMLLLKSMGHTGWSQMGIIFGAISVVVVLSFLTVYLFRKQILRRKRHHHHRSASKVAGVAESLAADDGGGNERKKLGRSRRPHRPLNPTLAQTRGLPPLRDEGTPPPPAP